jgi:hypothetical protein
MPRFGMSYAPTPGLTLNLAAGRSAQVMYSLHDQEAIASSVVAYDQMAAVPEEIGLTRAEDVVVGAEWSRRDLLLRVEAYGKRFDRLPLAPLPDNPIRSLVVIPSEMTVGTGTARGLEVLTRYARGGSGVSASYTLARVEREIDGRRYVPRFDRRHTLDLSAYRAWSERGQLTSRLVLASGQPFTPIVGTTQRFLYDPVRGIFHPGSSAFPVLGDHNSDRLPHYLRLDIGARRSFERRWFGSPGIVTPYLTVLNVLNTSNVLYAEPQESYGERMRLVYAPQLPVFPTVGVEWRF